MSKAAPKSPKHPTTFKIFRVDGNECIDSKSCTWVDRTHDNGYKSAAAAEAALVEIASYKSANKDFWFGKDFHIREVPLPIEPPPTKVVRTVMLSQQVSIVKTIK